MLKTKVEAPDDLNPQETSEWIEALDEIIDAAGPDRASYLLQRLIERAANLSVQLPLRYNTAYINTIPSEEEVAYPGDRAMERKIKSYVRWNATAMVVRANKYDANIGGHLATYASLATLLEVGFNHFFRGSYTGPNNEKLPGDFIYFQGHASPGVYARAFLEGRLSEEHLKNFRHELRDHPGLSSYPHPWLMPDFWQFPTVSMGLGPISAIYQARFQRYLENRGIIPATGRKIWAFLGDGECDEPESLGALTMGLREKLDNLVFVVNCNLQRLDGPVRGNGSIVQELEAMFRGAGWNVVKCLWGGGWDDLLARDASGLLIKRFHEVVDGEYQAYRANDGAYLRKEFFGKYPDLLKLVENMSDDDLWALRRGGLDPVKVFNAYRNAMLTTGRPTVILAKTVKGYGLGEILEGRNTAHQTKKLGDSDLLKVRDRFNLPLTDEQAAHLDFIKPSEDSPEMQYLRQRANTQGGYLPERKVKKIEITAPPLSNFQDTLGGSRGREASTTAAFVAVLKALMKTDIGKFVVPIVPDEARTFGMESLFRECGIYASQGQHYKPVDANVLLYYKEAQDGQILEEGINEAGSMASCLAAGTAYANHGVPMIPFYIYYSMFGFQRVGDQIWQFADSRGKGFLLGGTAGRSTLLGEGLQHQDGHSPLHASTVPNCIVYDPAYAYELAVIVQDGIRRMYQEMEDHFYYLTVYNENYVQPPMPDRPGVVEGILKGIYKYQAAEQTGGLVAQLFGSGSILNEALKAQKILAEKYQIAADVWSVTSYNELRREALETDRWNRLNPTQPARVPYISQVMQNERGPVIASSDYIKAQADQLSPWLGSRLTSLGADGFGRSENREHLRKFFEISAEAIVQATLSSLARNGDLDPQIAAQATADLGSTPILPTGRESNKLVTVDQLKEAAAQAAASLVSGGMVVGLGTGSTAKFAVDALARRMREENLKFIGIPTSEATAEQARGLGIPLTNLGDHPVIDLAIDGADEIVPKTRNLIKGRGGALLREKIVESAAKQLIIIADDSKLVEKLGSKMPVPVEVIQFGWQSTARKLESLGAKAVLRTNFTTDSGNVILDCAFQPIADPETLAREIDSIVGVVEHGLFLGMATKIFVAVNGQIDTY